METDRLGGTTYTLVEPERLSLRTRSSRSQYLGDLSDAEPVQQRRDRTAAHRAGIRHRLRPGRMEGRSEADAELRRALRLLHAADRDATICRSSSTPSTGVIAPTRRRPSARQEEQHPAARVVDLDTRDAGKTVFRGGFGLLRRPGADRRSDPASRERPHLEHDGQRRRVPGRISPRSARTSSTTRNNRALPAARLRPSTWSPSGSGSTRLGAARAAGGTWSPPPPTSAARDGTCSCAASRTASSTCGPIRIRRSRRDRRPRSSTSSRRGRLRLQSPYAEVDYKTSGGRRQLQRDAAVAGARVSTAG